ncbi:hypothetical protein CHARACLAT_028884 [Characodon lateralis]|uniref:Uncharacterized protein n=1 Tax=Characodon lateralis TaxID=208331 RepID=A0ABU7E4G7_9TELE|nr:hypothetical protein [Characodon lateralis]
MWRHLHPEQADRGIKGVVSCLKFIQNLKKKKHLRVKSDHLITGNWSFLKENHLIHCSPNPRWQCPIPVKSTQELPYLRPVGAPLDGGGVINTRQVPENERQ